LRQREGERRAYLGVREKKVHPREREREREKGE
jgi:hypothetical protein